MCLFCTYSTLQRGLATFHLPSSHRWLMVSLLDFATLDPCYSKGGLLPSHPCTVWWFTRNAESQALNQSLHFSQTPRSSTYILKFEQHYWLKATWELAESRKECSPLTFPSLCLFLPLAFQKVPALAPFETPLESLKNMIPGLSSRDLDLIGPGRSPGNRCCSRSSTGDSNVHLGRESQASPTPNAVASFGPAVRRGEYT